MIALTFSAKCLNIFLFLLWQHLASSSITNLAWPKLPTITIQEFSGSAFKEAYVTNRIHCAAVALSTTGSQAYCYDEPRCVVAVAGVSLYDIFGQDPGGPLCYMDENKQSPLSWGGNYAVTEGQEQIIYSHSGYGSVVYRVNYFVKWLFVAPAGKTVRLQITSFQTESGFDILEIKNGGTIYSPNMAKLSGSQAPAQFTTTGNLLFLYFSTDQNVDGIGWRAIVDAV